MIIESIKMSWQNIIHNKMRSFLTVLGIVIGVTAIIALITIVQGIIDDVNSQFSGLGADKLSVQAQGTLLKHGLSESDLEELTNVQNISGVSPTVSVSTDIIIGGVVRENVTLQGKNEVYFRHENELVTRGRAINALDVESKNRVCLISDTTEQELFVGGNAVGQSILIGGVTYEIIGVMENSSSIQSMFSGGKDAVVIPYKNAMRLAGANNITSVDMYMSDSNKSEEIIESIESVLNRAFNYKEDAYKVTNLESLLDVMHNMQNTLQMALIGIASIALLVGGIGIMNMMLVSVTERTTEIGLRKALGAQPSSIQFQFLMEAVFLSLFGGVIGILLGLLISWIAAIAIGIAFVLSTTAIVIGVSFSVAVGIIFGIAPARKASRLNPIDALRSI